MCVLNISYIHVVVDGCFGHGCMGAMYSVCPYFVEMRTFTK